MKNVRQINEQLRRLLKEDSTAKSTVYTPLCVNNEYQETTYLTQIDTIELEDVLNDPPENLHDIADKFIVTNDNYSYIDMINDGDFEEVCRLVGDNGKQAMTKYWNHAIANDGVSSCKEWFLMFDEDDNARWENNSDAKQFREIGAKLLKL